MNLAVRRTGIGIGAAALLGAWLVTALAAPTLGLTDPTFGIGTYITSSAATAYAWATTIVSFLNGWAGFAMAVAFAAGFGGSWMVVLIKGVLQKVGFRFAVQYASML